MAHPFIKKIKKSLGVSHLAMFRSNLAGKSRDNYTEVRFLRVRTIECEDILQKLKLDPNAGRVSFESNMQVLSDLSVGKNLSVGTNIVAQGTVSATGYSTFSDVRLKQNITALQAQDAYSIMDGLTPRRYTLRNATCENERIGFLAHEVKSVLPSAVTVCKGYDSVNYTELGVVLFKVVQDLRERIRVLEDTVVRLKRQVSQHAAS